MGCRTCCKTEDAHADSVRQGGREGFRKALLTPLGSAASSLAQAAWHGSQQLLLTDADGRGPRDAFSYGVCAAPSCRMPCLPLARPFPRRSERLAWDGSTHGGRMSRDPPRPPPCCSPHSCGRTGGLSCCITRGGCRHLCAARSQVQNSQGNPCHRLRATSAAGRSFISPAANVASPFAGLAAASAALPGRLAKGTG